MSPIGRVFIVLNAILAGAFVYFAGVFLQKSSDNRTLYLREQSERVKDKETWTKEKEALTAEINAAKRDLQSVSQKASSLESDLASKNRDYEQLNQMATQNSASLDALKTSWAGVATAFDSLKTEAEAGRKMWADADTKKAEAVKAMDEMSAKLGSAEQKIAGLERNLAEANAQIGSLKNETEGQKVMLSLVRQRYPGVLGNLAPQVDGQVSVVSQTGNYITAQITNAPNEIQAGWSLAVYGNGRYKGEAVITEVTKADNATVVFATVKHTTDGAKIAVGDRVSTNPGGMVQPSNGQGGK